MKKHVFIVDESSWANIVFLGYGVLEDEIFESIYTYHNLRGNVLIERNRKPVKDLSKDAIIYDVTKLPQKWKESWIHNIFERLSR